MEKMLKVGKGEKNGAGKNYSLSELGPGNVQIFLEDDM